MTAPAAIQAPLQRIRQLRRSTTPSESAEPSPTPTPSTPTASRLLVLDGLRLFAALLVVMHHMVRGSWGVEPEQHFGQLAVAATYGWLGVNLFFLISGFVICMSSWGRTVGEFAVSRIVRLFPAYWVGVVATTTVLALWPLLRKALPPAQSLVNITMLQTAFGVTDQDWSYWSLGTELRFYLLFAIVVALGVTYRRTVYFCAIWTLLAAFSSTWNQGWLNSLIVPQFAPYFVAGTALFLVRRFGGNLILWGMIALNWVIALYRLEKYDAVVDFKLSWWTVALIVTAFWGIMIAVAVGWLDRIAWRPLATAGALTYPLYLIHQAIGNTIIIALRDYVPAWVLLVGVVALLMGCAWLIHRYIERPGARLLKRGLTRSLAAIRAQ